MNHTALSLTVAPTPWSHREPILGLKSARETNAEKEKNARY